jgi:hypothetical protein
MRGPVGIVDVDAYTGEVLMNEIDAEKIIAHATNIINSVPPSDS